MCLAATCQRFYEIGRPTPEARLSEALVISWAGDRLVCPGDYAQLDDMPPGMLTDHEV